MWSTTLLLIAMTAAGPGEVPGLGDYARSLTADKLDQAALDAEGYGDKKALKREDEGLRITLPPGSEETGWRTPQQIRFGGDFTITAEFLIKKLPKPALEDGAAIGLAIAFGDVNQPDATLIRLLEPSGAEVYRTIDKTEAAAAQNPNQTPNQNQMMIVQMGRVMVFGGGGGPAGQPAKPQRRTFPAAGETVRMELRREGQAIRFQVVDAKSPNPRHLGQTASQGSMDVAAVKLFAVNRNGAEAVDVVLKSLTIRADRVNGLGTVVRTIYNETIHAEPTSIEDGALVLGGQPKPSATPNQAPAAGAPPAATTPAGASAPAPAVNGAFVQAPPGAAVEGAVFQAPFAIQTVPAAPIANVAGEPKPPADVIAPDAASGTAQSSAQAAEAAKPKPKAVVPLDELESIHFERTPTLTGRFVGQPNLDFTMPAPNEPKPDGEADAKKPDEPKKPGDDVAAPPPGTTIARTEKVEPKKNGIRDIQLALFGLRPSPIKQVMVNCQTDKGATTWQLDTTGSQSRPLVIHRSGTEIAADLFLEPPPGDCHEKSFTVNVTYEDGQSANANFQADGHSDAKLAVDPATPAFAPPDARVFLSGDEAVFGKLEGIDADKLTLATPWKARLEIPLSRVAGVHLAPLDRKESPDSFAKRLKSRGAEDLLLAQTKNGEVLAVSGVLERIDGDRLQFIYQDKSRTLPLAQVEGLVLAARPDPPADGLRSSFLLPGDVTVAGRWKNIEADAWTVETDWGQELKLTPNEVREIRFQGGKMTHLSDLQPSKVEETPFFGRPSPWQRDAGLTGGPLKIDGRTHERGIAVHSRSELTYDLDGHYETFEVLVGFDDEARGKGRVDCRIFADDKELYANPDLRADAPPVALKLSVASASQLRLLVDFGPDQDVGDRLIWANARLYREGSAKNEAATTTMTTEANR